MPLNTQKHITMVGLCLCHNLIFSVEPFISLRDPILKKYSWIIATFQ